MIILIGNAVCSPVLDDFTDTHTHTHTHARTHTTILRLFGFCPGQPGWGSTRRNIHPLTPVVVISHLLSASSIYCDPWHPPCSIYVPDSLFPQSLSKFSLVYLLAWHPPVHTPYVSSPNHCLLFAAHAHTIAICFYLVPRLCLPSLSFSPLLGILSCSFTPHWFRWQLEKKFENCYCHVTVYFVSGRGVKYCDEHICLSVWLSLSVHSHISETVVLSFAQLCVDVTYGHGSVLCWWQCNTLCTSGLWMTSIFDIMSAMVRWDIISAKTAASFPTKFCLVVMCSKYCAQAPMTSECCLYHAQCTHNRFTDRRFTAAGPWLWNDLPPELWRPDLTFHSFKQKLKTHLFGLGYLTRKNPSLIWLIMFLVGR